MVGTCTTEEKREQEEKRSEEKEIRQFKDSFLPSDVEADLLKIKVSESETRLESVYERVHGGVSPIVSTI